ncbi:MAG: hypothetical protein ABGY41_19920 [Candidatus Poribacteria bacterium]
MERIWVSRRRGAWAAEAYLELTAADGKMVATSAGEGIPRLYQMVTVDVS